MSIQRFFAKTTSEALRKVRDALGPEGVILSNRPMDGGIEILALRQDEITALTSPSAPRQPEAERSEGGSTFLSHVLSSKQARANEGKTNAGKTNSDKPGHEVKDFSPANGEGLSNPNRKTGLQSQNLHSFVNMSSQGAEPDSEVAERAWIRPITVNTKAAEQKVLDQSIDAARTREAFASAPRFAQNLSQPARGTVDRRAHRGADDMANHKANHKADRTVDHMTDQWGRSHESEAEISGKRPRGSRKTVTEILSDPASIQKRKSKHVPVIDTRELAAEVTSSLLKEIKSMRNALEQQFSALNGNGHERRGAAREHLLRNLLAAGFSIPLANGLMEQLPEHRDDGNDDGNRWEDAMNHVKAALIQNLKTISSEDEILEKGGIYALVGPTGVGKTTTTAKLAARCVVRHGAEKLALLTTDGYRIGGHEQLRIYGKILGVTVYAVKDAQDLALALGELRGKHMVLIDTVGVGQRDQMVAEQIAMFAGCGTEVKRLLLLNASSNLHTLNEVAEAYGGHGLAGAIITKLDEAVVTGCALDTAIRHRLSLYYVAQGQRVPEDLELANPQRLVDLALDNSPASPHFGLEGTFPLVEAHNKAVNTWGDMDGISLD